MHSRKTVPIIDLMSAANMELIRLDFKSSTLSRHSKEFRSFSNYCRENEITAYDAETGPQYFQHCYGLDIGNSTAKLTKQQLDTRCSIRFLDDIFQFGYALRYSHHDYTVPRQYVDLLEEYLAWCHRNNSSDGTIRVKRTKIRQFFCFLDGRGIELSDLTATEISDFMTTLCRYHRATIHVFSSVLRDFFRYLHENGILDDDSSSSVPRPKIYVEENIPETWAPEEVRQLLSVIDRSNAIGKRDYAMLLLAILLGMRAGDICALKFKNLDWHQKLITYTQQKTQKVNTLPLLPVIGDAIILFECKSVSGYLAESRAAREGLAGNAESGASSAVRIRGGCDGGGKGTLVQQDCVMPSQALTEVASTLRAGAGAPKHDADIRGRLAISYKRATCAGFKPGNSEHAQSIGYAEEQAPTLNAECGGNKPAVMCLNDQGGNVMGVSHDVSSTLRAQEHGHQPSILDMSHACDIIRDCGEIVPSLQARMGTGGNQVPLTYQMQGFGDYRAGEVASSCKQLQAAGL